MHHAKRVSKAGKTESNTTLVSRFFALAFKWPGRNVKHVIEHADRDVDDIRKRGKVEFSTLGKRIFDKQRQIYGAEATAPVRG